jgi:hypothetical protein
MNSYLHVVAERKRDSLNKLLERCREVERTKNKVEAVKLYRAETGASVKTAMEALK